MTTRITAAALALSLLLVPAIAQAFRDWAMANGYADHLSIHRIDNDGNYEPGNCRWATRKEQGRHKRSNQTVVRSDGVVFATIAEAAEATGGNQESIINVCRARQKTSGGYGWSYASTGGTS